MFPKLCCVVVAVGAFGCALLAMRQGRLQAASELTQTQLRISKLDRKLWDLRAQIAEQTTPTAIEKMAAGIGELRPMIPDDGSLDAELEAKLAKEREEEAKAGKPDTASAPPSSAAPQSSASTSTPATSTSRHAGR